MCASAQLHSARPYASKKSNHCIDRRTVCWFVGAVDVVDEHSHIRTHKVHHHVRLLRLRSQRTRIKYGECMYAVARRNRAFECVKTE